MSDDEAVAKAWEEGFQKGVEFSDYANDPDAEQPDYGNPYRSQA